MKKQPERGMKKWPSHRTHFSVWLLRRVKDEKRESKQSPDVEREMEKQIIVQTR
jgi:hypothetical protein